MVTGGDYDDKDTCYPYTMPFCNHHIEGSPYQDCAKVVQVEPKCKKRCNNNSNYKNDKHRAQSSYGFSGVDSIKKDI